MSEHFALITGGHGDLAEALRLQLIGTGFEVLSPGRSELDVLDPASVDSYFSGIGHLDLLVNNAGITGDALLTKQTTQERNDVIDTNLKGAHLCSQKAAVMMMRERSGHIINIGSYSALNPQTGQTAYASAKAGLIGLTKSYAKELGKRNIRINCVLPGFLETKMTSDLNNETITNSLQRHQLGRFTTIAEAARFIAFLSTTEHISGQVFQLDSRV